MQITNRKLRVGVVGMGHQSLEDHLPAIKKSSDVELVGVVDIDKNKLKPFLKNNKEVKVYTSFDNLLKKQKMDFIVVATPHYTHYEITKRAIINKIHVFKEKPFATSLEMARELKTLAEENNVKIVTTLQRRFNPIYSTFFQLINKIGRPFYIELQYTLFIEKPYEGWRGKKELAGGGCLIDMGYHIIDLLMWYFGLPDRVFAEISFAAKENFIYDAEDTARVIFRYSKKKFWGSLFVSRVIPPKKEFIDVYGTRGSIHIERGKIERRSSSGELLESLTRKYSWPSAAQDQLGYFVQVVRGNKENITSPEFHFNHLAFIEAAYKSTRENRYINPKDFLEL